MQIPGQLLDHGSEGLHRPRCHRSLPEPCQQRVDLGSQGLDISRSRLQADPLGAHLELGEAAHSRLQHGTGVDPLHPFPVTRSQHQEVYLFQPLQVLGLRMIGIDQDIIKAQPQGQALVHGRYS